MRKTERILPVSGSLFCSSIGLFLVSFDNCADLSPAKRLSARGPRRQGSGVVVEVYTFSKVLSISTLYRTYTRVLTF